MRRRFQCAPIALLLPLASSFVASAGFADTLADGDPSALLDIDDEWVTGVEQPTAMAFLPDGRVVITERAGNVVVRNPDGSLEDAGTIDVSYTSFQEKGLLNVVAHPDYESNNVLFFYYTGSGGGSDDNRVVSMELSPDNQLDTGSEVTFVDGIAAPLNHNGGGLAVLGDYLFIGTGDSGSNSNAHPSAERVTNYYPTCLTNLNGKVLRLHLDGSIPDDNPLVGQTVTACGNSPGTEPSGTSTSPRTEIFAWGFRNAFRVWGDPLTENLWVGHVGEVTYEMVNVVSPTGNQHFGWPFREGGEGRPVAECQDYEPNVGDCVDPVYRCESSMANPNNPDVPNDCRSMTGGLILNGCEWPAEFEGQYVFGDYSSQNVWTLQLNDERNDVIAERVNFATTSGGGPVQFIEQEGALYIVVYTGNGHIARIAPQNPEAACDGQTPGGAGGAGSGGGGGEPSGPGGMSSQGGSSGEAAAGGSPSGGGAPNPSGGGPAVPAPGGNGNDPGGAGPGVPPVGGGSPGGGGAAPGPGPDGPSPGNPGSAGDGPAGPAVTGPAPAGSDGEPGAGGGGAVASDDAASEDEGCGCRVVGARKSGGPLLLLIAALGLVFARRRR